MKKIIVILVTAFLFLNINAQRRTVVSPAIDTLNGNETVYFPVYTATSSYGVTIQALCTNIGGTSDGTLILEGSVDNTSWETIVDDDLVMTAYPNDTLTIVDAAVVQWVVLKNAWKYYRITGAGTASDTTLITPKLVPF